MKASSKAMWGTVSAIVGAMFVVAVVARLSVSAVDKEPLADPGPTLERQFDIDGFTSVDISGAWQARISSGAYAVSVRAPENYFDHLEVERQGDKLYLGYRSGARMSHDRIVGTVSMPTLEGLDASGASKVELTDIETDELTIDLSGASKVVSSGGRIGTLTLDTSGASKIDFSETPTTNAKVDLSGASKVEVWMDGGRLEGEASGASKVSYSGDVSFLVVDTSGASKVSRR